VVMVDNNYIGYLDRMHVFQHLLATSGVWTTSRDETIETNLANASQSQMKYFEGRSREKYKFAPLRHERAKFS